MSNFHYSTRSGPRNDNTDQYGRRIIPATSSSSLPPSAFPPGTDPNLITCFEAADQDGSGFIEDKELQRVLSPHNQIFALQTVHLLMYEITKSYTKKLAPNEFIQVYNALLKWRSLFERYDRDRSGKLDATELRAALQSLGVSISPVVVDLLVFKFDKSCGNIKAIEYDSFIECCIKVKGLNEKFKDKDAALSTYESFMMAILPYL